MELYDIDSLNAAERDGRDELRFLVGGNLFPRFNDNYFPMATGGDGDPADFEFPTTIVGTIGSVGFDLLEVTPPAAGTGVSLGVRSRTASRALRWPGGSGHRGDFRRRDR